MSTARTVPPRRQPADPMALMAGGVPLSLLLDLVLGPRSEDLLVSERPTTTQARRP